MPNYHDLRLSIPFPLNSCSIERALLELSAILESEEAIPQLDSEFVEQSNNIILLEEFMRSNGLTRIAEATQLDRLGVPVHYAVRPTAVHPICIVSQGKGFSLNESRAKALLECYERWSAEQYHRVTIRTDAEELNKTASSNFEIVRPRGYSNQEIRWVLGFNGETLQPTWLPLQSVAFPRPLDEPLIDTMGGDTSGLAAGTDLSGAVFRGCMELAERHVFSVQNWPFGSLMEKTQLSKNSVELVEKMNRAEIEVALRFIEMPFQMYLVYAVARDRRWPLAHLNCGGTAMGYSLEDAAQGALLELIQSRSSCISLLRDDLPAIHKKMVDYNFDDWFRPQLVNVAEVSSNEARTSANFLDCLGRVLKLMSILSGNSPTVIIPLHCSVSYATVRVVNLGLKRHWRTEQDSLRCNNGRFE